MGDLRGPPQSGVGLVSTCSVERVARCILADTVLLEKQGRALVNTWAGFGQSLHDSATKWVLPRPPVYRRGTKGAVTT